MKLLSKENIKLFENLDNINDGFRIPDEAYVHGKDFECFEQLGGDGYFSNYWYGEKELAITFAEELASYFKNVYNNTPLEEGNYDFYGMVLLWYVGEKALVASINLDSEYCFCGFDNNIPSELKSVLKQTKMKLLLNDDNDNTSSDILYSNCSKSVKKELLSCVSENFKEDYINDALEQGISIN